MNSFWLEPFKVAMTFFIIGLVIGILMGRASAEELPCGGRVTLITYETKTAFVHQEWCVEEFGQSQTKHYGEEDGEPGIIGFLQRMADSGGQDTQRKARRIRQMELKDRP